MNIVLLILPALLAAALSFALTPLARKIAFRIGAIDHPGPRKVHLIDVPRLGGLAVLASVTTVLLILWLAHVPRIERLATSVAIGIAAGLLPIVFISIWDDIRPRGWLSKLAAHFTGASIAVALGIRLAPDIHLFGNQIHIGWLAIPISIFWLAGLTNAFNIVDGLDGLSAGLALISAISLAAVSAVGGRLDLATAALILAGALIGFLPYNLYPAKIFLGDSGATAVGFILAALALRGGRTLSSGMAVLVPIVVLGLPIAETLISMLRRLVRRTTTAAGGGMFEGDREHIHHRLLALGFNQRKAVLILYGVGLFLALVGFGSIFLSHRGAAVLLGTMIVAAALGVARLGYNEFSVVRSGAVLRMYEVPVLKKSFFVVFLDLTIVVGAVYATFGLKYEDWGLVQFRGAAQALGVLMPAATLLMLFTFGVYRSAWRLATVSDFIRTSLAMAVAAFGAMVGSQILWTKAMPVSWFIIYLLVVLAGINGVRASYRLLSYWSNTASLDGDPVVIYGAGVGGTMAIREALSNHEVHIRPIGFIDDDPEKSGRVINGYPVLGGLEALESLIAGGRVKGVVVASGKIPMLKVREAADICERSGTWMKQFRMEFGQPLDGTMNWLEVAKVSQPGTCERPRFLRQRTRPGIMKFLETGDTTVEQIERIKYVAVKRAYRKPALVRYGAIAEITKSQPTAFHNDPGSGSGTMT
jgi:UDP-GlcNAc:undecaprenyl-phosphate/decaprenyl-phosphate GlcNAc-1-phosphate transferase